MMPIPTSGTPSSETSLLILLLTGHVLADFLIQTREDVEAKNQGRGYASHGIAVFTTHLIVLLPLLTVATGVTVGAIAAVHVTIDWLKCNWVPESWGSLRPFALDQVAHALVILLAWLVLHELNAVPAYGWLSAESMSIYLEGALLASAFAFNATGGSVIVAGTLNLLPDEEENEDPAGYPGAGRMIGILERTLMLAFVLYEQWAAIMLLITAKSIARFEEIKVRKFAEYYLIGTLTSLLVAVAIGFMLKEGLLFLLG